jgi:hypothetical protein
LRVKRPFFSKCLWQEQSENDSGGKAKGRHILKGAEGYNLREEAAPYNTFFRAENNDIGPENTYFWDITA